MQTRTPRHTEFTPMVGWARILTWVAVAAGVWAALTRPPGDGSSLSAGLLAAGIVGFGVLLEVVLGGLTVALFDDRLRVSLGRVPLIRKWVGYDSIDRIEAVTYRPLREFGGWGVRGFGAKQAWTARGNRALVLHRTDGTQLYLGSDHPDRLGARLRGVAGRAFEGA